MAQFVIGMYLFRAHYLAATDASVRTIAHLHDGDLDAHEFKVGLVWPNSVGRLFAFRLGDDTETDAAHGAGVVDIAVG